MKSLNKHDTLHHKIAYRMLRDTQLYLFCNKFPHSRHPNPVSTANWINKSQIPQLVPSFNNHAQVLSSAIAADTCTYIFALAANGEFSDLFQITSDDIIVILDSDMSSPTENDFESITPVQDAELKGIASVLAIASIGTIIMTFLHEFGNQVPIRLTALHVPNAPACLLLPQQLQVDLSSSNGAWIGNGSCAKVFYNGSCIHYQYDATSNLPIAWLAPGMSKYLVFCGSVTNDAPSTDTVVSPQNLPTDNLLSIQHKRLHLHHCYSHINMTTIQD
jgi:hypothetical protein